MRKWLIPILLAGVLLGLVSVRAQNAIRLARLQVQLWPEYDQPSMLVIYDFQLPDSIKLPVSVSVRFPKDANLIAVASESTDGSLLNADYLGPSASDTWQTVTIQIQTPTTYHLEYYQPLSKTGQIRRFSYLWTGDYAVDDFSVSVRVPTDTTDIITTPDLKSTAGADGVTSLTKDFGILGAGQEFPLQLSYTKTSDTLSVPEQKLAPSEPLGANTPGRVMLSNYWQYIIGIMGLVLILGGSVYFWQSNRGRRSLDGRHRHRGAQAESQASSDLYCHQCGTRAQAGDRFCRVCGTKLRLPE